MSRIVLVTGMSGAGRTTALKGLEDLGFEAVDNLPATLLGQLIRSGDRVERDVAIGIDCRTRAFDPQKLASSWRSAAPRQAPTCSCCSSTARTRSCGAASPRRAAATRSTPSGRSPTASPASAC